MFYSVKDYRDGSGNLIGVAKWFDHVPTPAEFGLGDGDWEVVEVEIIVGDAA